jgi:MoxR-like ATPase
MAAGSNSARERIAAQIVGRKRELDLLLAAVVTGRDVVLEGPPGTSKTTILKAITREWGVPLVLAEGNAELTPAKLLGYHDPARVMREGYSNATFVDGPLVQAMRSGSFLYVEEFNRAPEDTLNALLTAIADRSIAIPRVGVVDAQPTFRVLASMNPYDNVGTTRLSTSIKDRLCRIDVGYQDAASELQIVILRTGLDADDALTDRAARDAVALTRATRRHADIRQGSSVRGAIDLSLIACELLRQRGLEASAAGYAETILDAMLVALSGRILVDEASGASPAWILREIWESHFVLDEALAEPG